MIKVFKGAIMMTQDVFHGAQIVVLKNQIFRELGMSCHVWKVKSVIMSFYKTP